MSDRDDFFNQRIQDLEFRLGRLERFQNVLTSTQTLTTFTSTGGAGTKSGLQSDNRYAFTVFNSSQNQIIRLGQQSDGLTAMDVFDNAGVKRQRSGQLTSTGRYGTEVYDNAGNVKARLGKLNDGTYGVEVSTGGSGLVHLETLAFGLQFSNSTAVVTTNSTSYVDSSPVVSVTVNVGKTGRCAITGGAFAQAKSANQSAVCSYVLDSNAAVSLASFQIPGGGVGGGGASISGTKLLTGLSTGSHTIKLQIKTSLAGTTAAYSARFLIAIPY